jgi:hypothetical protein
MGRVVIAARYMFAMLRNGLEYGNRSSSEEERLQNLYRRMRFEHHGHALSLWS